VVRVILPTMSEQMTPPPPNGSNNQPGRSGKTTAAGVLVVIQGAVWLLMAIALLSFRTSAIGSIFDDLAGGILTLVTIVVFLIGGGCLWTGISLLRSKSWARITAIVIGAIDLLISIITVVSPDGVATGLIMVIWSGAIIYLSASAKVGSN